MACAKHLCMLSSTPTDKGEKLFNDNQQKTEYNGEYHVAKNKVQFLLHSVLNEIGYASPRK